jgi:hypothetical protein
LLEPITKAYREAGNLQVSIKEKISWLNKTFWKAVRVLLSGCAVLFVTCWVLLHYTEIVLFFDRYTVADIDTAQIDSYYDLLSRHEKAGKNLILDLGVKDTDDLRIALGKLKDIMGMRDTPIDLSYSDWDGRPASIQSWGDDLTIYVSPQVGKRREQINLLTHELCHIYVWQLKKSIFGALDQEKLVDCASVFLGLGVLALNGMTYEIGPPGYETRIKTFGYLKPEQFGYLLARYCQENGISAKMVKQYLTTAGQRGYYDDGRAYLRKRTQIVNVPEPILKSQSFIRRRLEVLCEKVSLARAKLDTWWEALRDKIYISSGVTGRS